MVSSTKTGHVLNINVIHRYDFLGYGIDGSGGAAVAAHTAQCNYPAIYAGSFVR